MARKAASVQTGAWSSSLNSKETPKVSKRGVRGEGHPSKQTPEVVSKLARAISLGLNDEESASLAGISDLTLTKWKRDPAFLRHIKNAVASRLALRLEKIERGEDGWQGCGWLLERLHPTRFSKPEVQIAISNTASAATNALTIVISAEEAKQVEAQVEPIRDKVREMFSQYRPALFNGEKPAEEVEAEVIFPSPSAPITMVKGEPDAAWWLQLVKGADTQAIEKPAAILACRLILADLLGSWRARDVALDFDGEPTVGDVHAALERLTGGPLGWRTLLKKAGCAE